MPPPAVGAAASPTPGLTSNAASSDDGGLDAGSEGALWDAGAEVGDDAGDNDAGPFDAGPSCPAWSHAAGSGCVSDVAVWLTGSALAIQGDTLIAGSGQQPVLRAYLDALQGLGLPEVTIRIAGENDAGVLQEVAAEEVADDAGTHFDLAWDTRKISEGRYSAVALVALGDAGFESNPVEILVDRTPPALKLTLEFDLDAGVQPRDFGATAIAASGDRGAGGTRIAFSLGGSEWGTGTQELRLRQTKWVDVPTTWLPTVENGTTLASTRVDARAVPFDAWSSAHDGCQMVVRATATDLAGNSAISEVNVPVTRSLWDGLDAGATGPLALGARGEILVNAGTSLATILPDGTIQSSRSLFPFPMPGNRTAVGAPATLVDEQAPEGEVFVRSLVAAPPDDWYQLTAFGPSDGGFYLNVDLEAQPWPRPPALALSAGRETAYSTSGSCEMFAIDPSTGKSDPSGAFGFVTPNPYVQACGGLEVVVSKSFMVGSSPGTTVTFSLDQLVGDGTRQVADDGPSVAPAFLGDLAVVSEGDHLALFTPGAPAVKSIALDDADPVSLVTSSGGDIYVLSSAGVLSKLDPSGMRLWRHQLGVGSGSTGLVVGAEVDGGSLIYAVDGSGQLSAYGSDGALHWSSPPGTVHGDPMIDRCTSHAYAGVAGQAPVAVALDSPGVDAAPGAWPMRGHDVFQTYDSEATADVNCRSHY